ncbi:MAG: MFS transporter, partial [Vicinamibacterales bacterium]
MGCRAAFGVLAAHLDLATAAFHAAPAPAAVLQRIETDEPPIDRPDAGSIRRDVADGLRALLGHRLLRPIVLGSIVDSVFGKAVAALYLLYASRDLEISPFALGIIFAAGGAGAIPGALLSDRTARRFGVGPTIVGGWFVTAAALLVVPLASGPLAVPLLAAGMLLGGVAGTILNI